MSRLVLLDSGPLGMIIHPRKNPDVKDWLSQLILSGVTVLVPEIADYEVRRKLIHLDSQKSIDRLNSLKNSIGYVPLTTKTMLKAAEFWAQARKGGYPTADKSAIDADVILAAQLVTMDHQQTESVIATTNVGHLARFVQAKNWVDIR